MQKKRYGFLLATMVCAASSVLCGAADANAAVKKDHKTASVAVPSVGKANKASQASQASKSVKAVKTNRASLKPVQTKREVHGGRVARASRAVVAAEPPRQSFGQQYGLHDISDPLALKSGAALVLDQDTNEVLVNKNSQAVLPIASITKLMTALVITEARLPADEVLTITQDDVDTEKGSRSRLKVGTRLTRLDMLHLALMSSENRAANALGRNYPGGLSAFVAAMNAKARALGMLDTRYVEPTGLSSQNQSSAHDLALLVKTAYTVPLIRDLSTSPEGQVAVGSRQVQFHTTNRLLLNPEWDIGVQKTGFINEAGQCLVMQAQTAGRKLILVLLDSAGKYSRLGDAERIRKWLLASAHPHAATEIGLR